MAIPSRQIGWGTESNLLWQILKQLNKLTSVLFGLKEAATPNYKVFTALLTQSGTSSTVNATSGLLIVGVSYNIDTYNAGDDFSNVGGPAAGLQGEWDGYSFLATGTTPNNWNNLSSLDYNTGAPVATVLENTIGNVYWSYITDGGYRGTIDEDLVTEGKQAVFSPTFAINTSVNDYFIAIENITVNGGVGIYSTDGIDYINGILLDFPIEIRVYS
jgi:hypothetical protein